MLRELFSASLNSLRSFEFVRLFPELGLAIFCLGLYGPTCCWQFCPLSDTLQFLQKFASRHTASARADAALCHADDFTSRISTIYKEILEVSANLRRASHTERSHQNLEEPIRLWYRKRRPASNEDSEGIPHTPFDSRSASLLVNVRQIVRRRNSSLGGVPRTTIPMSTRVVRALSRLLGWP